MSLFSSFSKQTIWSVRTTISSTTKPNSQQFIPSLHNLRETFFILKEIKIWLQKNQKITPYDFFINDTAVPLWPSLIIPQSAYSEFVGSDRTGRLKSKVNDCIAKVHEKFPLLHIDPILYIVLSYFGVTSGFFQKIRSIPAAYDPCPKANTSFYPNSSSEKDFQDLNNLFLIAQQVQAGIKGTQSLSTSKIFRQTKIVERTATIDLHGCETNRLYSGIMAIYNKCSKKNEVTTLNIITGKGNNSRFNVSVSMAITLQFANTYKLEAKLIEQNTGIISIRIHRSEGEPTQKATP